MKIKNLFIMVIFILFASCSDGEKGLKEQSFIQTNEEIRAQNENQEVWAAKLSADLKVRRTFIDAIEGEFEGSFDLRSSSFKVRLVIIPTIPAYEVNRSRTLSELEYELQNLGINVHVIQWNPDTDLSGVSCILEGIKPNVGKGIIDLITENCKKNTYKFFLAEDLSSDSDIQTEGQNTAALVRSGQIKYVQALKGKLRSNARVYNLTLERK
ncbi:MAG: hypothetical protein KC493_13620 [Bacteriovoracaceae bacterium]|nr:hypothetical protein [Bacteriovoracaceae bacterium]